MRGRVVVVVVNGSKLIAKKQQQQSPASVVVADDDGELANVELSSVLAFTGCASSSRRCSLSPRHKVTAELAHLRMTDGGLHWGAVADDG